MHMNHQAKIILLTLSITLLMAPNGKGQNLEKVKTELEGYFYQSMKYRRSLGPIMQKYGQKSGKFDSLNTLIYQYDSLSLIKAEKIIKKYGWLGKSKIGSLANNALFLIIQHSNTSTMQKYFPVIKASSLKKETNPYNVALMEDRILVTQGQPQKYGTQYYYDKEKKRYYYYKLDNLKLVDQRRKKLGIESLKENARENNVFLPKEHE